MVIAGKGHETVQIVGDRQLPFDDRAVAVEALRTLGGPARVVALLLAASLAVASSLVGTKMLIDILVARHVGQPIHEDVPLGHTIKAGTPTMGGIAIVGAASIGYVVAHVTQRPRVHPHRAAGDGAASSGPAASASSTTGSRSATSATSG